MKCIILILFLIVNNCVAKQDSLDYGISLPVIGNGLHSYTVPFEYMQETFDQNGNIPDTLFGYVNRVYSPNKEYYFSREYDDSSTLSILAIYKKSNELTTKIPTSGWLNGNINHIWIDSYLVLNFSYRDYDDDTIGTFISIVNLENGQQKGFSANKLHIIGKTDNKVFFQPWHRTSSVESIGLMGINDFVSLGIDGLKFEKIPHYEKYNLTASSGSDTIFHIELHNDYTYLSCQISKSKDKISLTSEIWYKGKQLQYTPRHQQLKISDSTIDWVEWFFGSRNISTLLRLKNNKVDTLVDLNKHDSLFVNFSRIADFQIGGNFILLNIQNAKHYNSESGLFVYDRENNRFLKPPAIVLKDN
ncbi:MAG TPA: hypothetical protein VEC36_04080 [Patescibacteria group bacterium]|nr:hypothetical protein [Patescibacteria group bacterium]